MHALFLSTFCVCPCGKIVNKGKTVLHIKLRLTNGMDNFHTACSIDMYYCVMLERFVIELQVHVVLFDAGVSTEDVRRWLHRHRREGGVLQRWTTNIWVIHRCLLRPTHAPRQHLHQHASLSCISVHVHVRHHVL